MRRGRWLCGLLILAGGAILLGLGLLGCGGVATNDLGQDTVSATAKTSKVSGRVVDGATAQQPGGAYGVWKAKVKLVATVGSRKYSGQTNKTGYYNITQVRVGSYYVFVTPPAGYPPAFDPDGNSSNGIGQITVVGGEKLTLPDIVLIRSGGGPPPPPF